MRFSLLAMATLCSVVPIDAQAFVRVSAGVTGGTVLVQDFIVEPVSARQSIAPTGIVSVGYALSGGYRVALEARMAIGTLEIEDRGTTDDLGGLTTLGLMLVADGPIRGFFRWEAGAGMLRYQPENEIGIFSRGGPSLWIVGAGVAWSRPVSAAMQIVAGARYDFHPFTSDRLTADDYSSHQAVHRVGLSVGLERSF